MANLKTQNQILIINALWFIEINKRVVTFYLSKVYMQKTMFFETLWVGRLKLQKN